MNVSKYLRVHETRPHIKLGDTPDKEFRTAKAYSIATAAKFPKEHRLDLSRTKSYGVASKDHLPFSEFDDAEKRASIVAGENPWKVFGFKDVAPIVRPLEAKIQLNPHNLSDADVLVARWREQEGNETDFGQRLRSFQTGVPLQDLKGDYADYQNALRDLKSQLAENGVPEGPGNYLKEGLKGDYKRKQYIRANRDEAGRQRGFEQVDAVHQRRIQQVMGAAGRNPRRRAPPVNVGAAVPPAAAAGGGGGHGAATAAAAGGGVPPPPPPPPPPPRPPSPVIAPHTPPQTAAAEPPPPIVTPTPRPPPRLHRNETAPPPARNVSFEGMQRSNGSQPTGTFEWDGSASITPGQREAMQRAVEQHQRNLPPRTSSKPGQPGQSARKTSLRAFKMRGPQENQEYESVPKPRAEEGTDNRRDNVDFRGLPDTVYGSASHLWSIDGRFPAANPTNIKRAFFYAHQAGVPRAHDGRKFELADFTRIFGNPDVQLPPALEAAREQAHALLDTWNEYHETNSLYTDMVQGGAPAAERKNVMEKRLNAVKNAHFKLRDLLEALQAGRKLEGKKRPRGIEAPYKSKGARPDGLDGVAGFTPEGQPIYDAT